jgi:hypothetical protein
VNKMAADGHASVYSGQSQMMRQALVCCTCVCPVFAVVTVLIKFTEMVGSSIDAYTVFLRNLGRAEVRITCGIPCLRFFASAPHEDPV